MEKTILIADDVELNREILAEMFRASYTIVKATNGLEAVEEIKHNNSIIMVLLDIQMPKADGFYVLEQMRQMNLLRRIPVIFITGEADSIEYQRRGYVLGVTDIISKPFDKLVVKQRVDNAIALYESKNNTEEQVAKLTAKIQHTNDEIINGFSALVESRNKESKWHIIHIRLITEIILEYFEQIRPGEFTTDIQKKIIRAAAVHDIGKYMIPDVILNKPLSQGRLTPEEYEIMKSHTTEGFTILNTLFKDIFTDDPEFYNYCLQITRSHHERWDGNGYPDGLKGDEIPFAAQIVSLADVYDALISERCYKKAIPHDVSIKMIIDGQCGVFNPELIECLVKVADGFRFIATAM
ncbi:MAG: response regulator [Treponema sp.]|nr:response regulator [Treponema sp.]